MERGADWEHEAVRERWAALERQRALTTRFLAGLWLGLLAVLLLLLATASEACVGDGGVPPTCVSIVAAPIDVLLVPLGSLALAGGAWLCWSSLRD